MLASFVYLHYVGNLLTKITASKAACYQITWGNLLHIHVEFFFNDEYSACAFFSSYLVFFFLNPMNRIMYNPMKIIIHFLKSGRLRIRFQLYLWNLPADWNYVLNTRWLMSDRFNFVSASRACIAICHKFNSFFFLFIKTNSKEIIKSATMYTYNIPSFFLNFTGCKKLFTALIFFPLIITKDTL